jgi:PAS domain S-box-containing protein
VNPAYCRILGLARRDLLGRALPRRVPERVRAALRPLQMAALAGEPGEWRGRFGSKPGRLVEWQLRPHANTSGDTDGYVVLLHDVTDLARSLASLQETQAAQWAILNAALDSVVTIDERGHIVEFNPAAEAAFGFTRDEVLGRPLAETIVPEHFKAAHQKGLARYLGGGAPRVLGRRIEIEARRKDGRTVPVELAITEVVLDGRRLFTAYLRDLSARKAAEGEMERQREALHQREKMAALGSLLAGVAHELNNPLSIVVGQSQLLLETLGDPEGAARAAKIQAAAERCARIVRTFLDMARNREPMRRAVDVNEVVERALELLDYGLRTAGVEVRRNLAPGLPPVSADPHQLQQVVANLLINAQQALEERPKPRRLTVTTRREPDGYLRLVVSDNGPGVPASARPRIFEPFFTTKPFGVGTGVGLSVCHAIVAQHDGQISLEDTPGGGATFVVALPAAATAAAHGDPAMESVTPMPAARRALVVDDEVEVAEVLEEILQGQGFEVDTVHSGAAALERLRTNDYDYDAILCDLRMPDTDGAMVYAWLRRERPALATRVLFVTGDTLGPAASRFLASAGRPFLEKPFLPADVRRVLTTLFPA